MPEPTFDLNLPDAAATEACGARLAAALPGGQAAPFVIHLAGELGTGKTTLVRGVLRAIGVGGTIRSPTYTLVESYGVGARTLVHLDLYRLESPRELEALDVRELLRPDHVLLIEWPERGGTGVPRADLVVEMHFAPEGRRLGARSTTRAGEPVVQAWFR
jgi:tRNA threonylcarbamoyladenosine biosynthesis protein TsaE